MLEVRVADGSLLRLIGKCVHVGVLDGEAVVEPELGTVQGSVLSPLLGNVYLHSVGTWAERWASAAPGSRRSCLTAAARRQLQADVRLRHGVQDSHRSMH